MSKIQVGIAQDAEGRRFLTVSCPDCERENRFAFEILQPEMKLDCVCGVGFNLSQANYDDLRDKYGLTDPTESAN